jgi:hypothetical protein
MADQIRPFLGRDRAAKVAHTTPPGIDEEPRAGSRPHGRSSRRPVEDLAEQMLSAYDVLQDTHSQLFALLNRSQLVNDVLGVELVTFDSTGTIAREYRTQVGAVEVINHSTANDVIVSSAPPTVTPSGGKGVYRVGAGQRQIVHIGTHVVTLYGTSGQQVSYSAFTKPQPPSGGVAAPLSGFTTPASSSATTINALPQRPGTPLDQAATAAVGASASVTLAAGGAAVRTWITGFELTWDGSGTGAVNDALTVAGPSSNLSYVFATAAGVGGSLVVEFPQPVPASALNASISAVTGSPANRAALALTVHGFRL